MIILWYIAVIITSLSWNQSIVDNNDIVCLSPYNLCMAHNYKESWKRILELQEGDTVRLNKRRCKVIDILEVERTTKLKEVLNNSDYYLQTCLPNKETMVIKRLKCK